MPPASPLSRAAGPDLGAVSYTHLDVYKRQTIANVVRKLEEHGAMEYTIVVAASASESAALQYIAPYSGCTMGEYFRDRGQDLSLIHISWLRH